MKLIITEKQLNEVVNILSEKYVEDPYFKDNDIYDYEPNQTEIDSFNKVDRPSYNNFKGFGVSNNPNKIDPNKDFDKPIKFKREKPSSGKKYTGMAKIIYTYPNGMQVDVPGSLGPVAIVFSKLKKLKSQNTSDSSRYVIKYEITENKIFEDIHPSEAYDDIDSLMTVVKGKRPLCFLNFINKIKTDKMVKIIGANKLNVLKVPSNKFNGYIIYRDGHLDGAEELKSLMDANDGYLPSTGDSNTIYRIGKLLGYYEDEIISFIKNKKN